MCLLSMSESRNLFASVSLLRKIEFEEFLFRVAFGTTFEMGDREALVLSQLKPLTLGKEGGFSSSRGLQFDTLRKCAIIWETRLVFFIVKTYSYNR